MLLILTMLRWATRTQAISWLPLPRHTPLMFHYYARSLISAMRRHMLLLMLLKAAAVATLILWLRYIGR